MGSTSSSSSSSSDKNELNEFKKKVEVLYKELVKVAVQNRESSKSRESRDHKQHSSNYQNSQHQFKSSNHHHFDSSNDFKQSDCGCEKNHHAGGHHGFLHSQNHNPSHFFHHHNSHFNGHFIGSHCEIPFRILPFHFTLSNFRLNFNGLNGNLAFQLFRFKGCKVKLVLECGEHSEEVKGMICNTGTNFVDILQENDKVVTVLIERICKIVWVDKHCNPCSVCCNHGQFDDVCPHCGKHHDYDDDDDEEKNEDDEENEENEDTNNEI